ncbi:hypothetical protein ACIBEJ_40855 [Nonomuraea sp. NPDC050790]|uniref:hypothetical protein n=1 Tax=Nonomuraea sp. NPDC050790 TaxID=3364371 RepID=UPI0037892D55
MSTRFSATAWERSYRRTVRLAFSRVPFYRDQWVRAGRALDEPLPTPTGELAGQLHRLCPFGEPYDPGAEPSLWIGPPGGLRAALTTALGAAGAAGFSGAAGAAGVSGAAGVAGFSGAARLGGLGRVPVLEVRRSVLDRRRLGAGGPPYGVLLEPGATVVHERRRRELNAPALALATRAGRAVVVGERAAVASFLPELEGVEVRVLERVTLAGAAEGVLVHDPHLGYYAARARCGRVHLLWRRFHARPEGGGLAVSALGRRRPVLVAVVPEGGGEIGRCPGHGTPILGVST